MSEHKSTKGTWHFPVLDGNCQERVPGLLPTLRLLLLEFSLGRTKSAAVAVTPYHLLLPLVLGFLRVAPPIIESEVSKKESAEHNDGKAGYGWRLEFSSWSGIEGH